MQPVAMRTNGPFRGAPEQAGGGHGLHAVREVYAAVTDSGWHGPPARR